MTIMIIDDDADDRMLFEEALSEIDNSLNFVPASSCEMAMEQLDVPVEYLPQFIFLDLNMPSMNGWQCLSKIRKMEHLKNVPVIIYSTSQSPDNHDKIKSLKSTYFLAKPSKYRDLVNAIRIVIHGNWDKLAELNGKKNR
jgi:CheY-like chemotaxis protein